MKLRHTFQRSGVSAVLSGSIKVKLLALLGIILLLNAIGTIVAVFIFKMPLIDAAWWAWTHVLDPGFLADDKDSWLQKMIGSALTVLGLVIVGGAFITLAEEAARRTFENIRKGRVPSNLKGHTVIAGTGQKLKSFIAALKNLPLSQDGTIIVVIPDISMIDATREICGKENIRVTVARIWVAEAQKRLALKDAKRVLILDNFGGDNGNMLAAIFNIANLRKETGNGELDNAAELKVYVEVNDRKLLQPLQYSVAAIRDVAAKMEVNIMNMADTAARLAICEHPLDCVPVTAGLSGQVVLIILGWSTFADALFWQAIRLAHYPSKPTRIIVVDPSAEGLKHSVLSTTPGIIDARYARDIMHIDFIQYLSSVNLELAEENIVTVAVCGINADDVFTRALQLYEAPLPGLKQIFIDLPDGSGYSEALKGLGGKNNLRLVPVGSHAQAFELSEKMDKIAKVCHKQYIEERERKEERIKLPDGSYKNKSDNDWENLDEVHRGWNRTPVDHAEVKLRALADLYELPRHTISGVIELNAALKSKAAEIINHVASNTTGHRNDLELLSSIEHDRWSGEKVAEGWAYGTPKDDGKKLSPFLVRYDELDEKTKGYDREQVVMQLKNAVKSIPLI